MTIHSVLIQKLLNTNAHLGRRVAADHFKAYTYGIRNGMAIIDSDKTLIALRSACAFIGAMARQKARFLFVNTNPLFDEIFEQMTKRIGLYNPNQNSLWRTGGFLTNSFSPKRFRSRNKKLCFAPPQPPDCVVIFDTERKSSVIFEAEKLQIPVVALVDSSMPLDVYKRIAYPVPANDSVQFVYLFCNLITKTFLLEQKRFGGTAREDSAAAIPSTNDASKIENHREEAERIEESKSESFGFANDEVLVVPYESLTPVSGDKAEIKELLDKLVVLKFNGTLGTEMGFDGPKSAIEVCNGLTFLDLIVNQIESLNSSYGCNVPLLLMNTIKTNDDTVKVLEKYPKSNIVMLKSFYGQTSENESYPSDHDVEFLSLMKRGTLDALLTQGKEYILVVGSDNVAAVIDPKILKHLVQNKIEYCMEVTPTTSFGMDNDILNASQQKFQLDKIARNSAPQSMDKFKLIDTRSLWVNFRATKRLVDTDALKFENYSVSKGRETAAGSTIRFFDRAIGINVPQSRFWPINATSDLLIFQSDLYTYNNGILVRNAARSNPVNPSIDLGPEFGQVSDFLSRFRSIPSIIELDSLKVTGDVWFGTDITLKGKVNIVAKPGMRLEIPNGVVLQDKDISGPKDI
ncbi:UTP--glucose-1-phosphate uridylyltransferase-like [Corylus avellana]|uniref:UTP--glucose-1-phosphate uridylyltransferase-like n=1 Tax=Corylus avellana TaxID=13451 RepID=UPI002869FFB8|nr:UTP--glucose-1-phosphate uridylyltransferase-like [Corylus avellana]